MQLRTKFQHNKTYILIVISKHVNFGVEVFLMLTRLSKKLTCFFIRKNAININEREVYDYCFEIFLSTILNLISIIVIAIITKTYIISSVFIVVFISMRFVAGGYHAKTHFRCFLILLGVYGSLIAIIKFAVPLFLTGLIFSIIACIIYCFIAPVENENNPFDTNNKKKQLKMKIIFLLFIYTTLSIIFLHVNLLRQIGFAIAYANLCVSVSCLCAVIKKKLINKNFNK